MGRSRSRSLSPRRRRDRDRERERDRDRRRRRSRERDRERDRRRSPSERHRHRSRSRSSRSRSREKATGRLEDLQNKRKKTTSATNSTMFVQRRPVIAEIELQGKTEEEKDMMRTMGFGNFDTTKGKKVNGNEQGEVHVILKRKYRQYMNRKGGFNRPLDFVA